MTTALAGGAAPGGERCNRYASCTSATYAWHPCRGISLIADLTQMLFRVEFRRPQKSQLLPVKITAAEDRTTYVRADDEQGVAQVAAESEHSAPSAAAVALAKDKKCSVAVVYE
jgi:hypothetical protein